MLKKLFRAASFAIASITIISSILFAGCTNADAVVKGWTPPEKGSNSDNSLEIVVSPSRDNQNLDKGVQVDIENKEDYPDLGSDQVFPFISGFDSYK